jgi:hypothetical protein
LEGINKPDKGYQKSTKEEHDGLFLDDSEVVFVIVMVLEGFHEDGHDGSCEEHT